MEKITWKSIQNNSDQYLADGLWKLAKSPYRSFSEILDNSFGNYLISHEKNPYYIGESNDINKRLRQQFNPTTSTFYKNYLKYLNENNKATSFDIEHFKVQHIQTLIGRKEIEEFGIVNLPTVLNSFQLGKRAIQTIKSFKGIWEELQNSKSELLVEGEKQVLKQSFYGWHDINIPKIAGIYIIAEKGGNIIYIGESSDLNERHSTHSRRTYFSALRRHIATEKLSFELTQRNGKKKYLETDEENAVNDFLRTCSVNFCPVSLGRYELEEYLIRKHKPQLNRKGNSD